MNKKYVFAILMLIAVFVVAGCGSSIGGNIIKDEGSLVKIMDEFKNLDGLKVKRYLFFRMLICILVKQETELLSIF